MRRQIRCHTTLIELRQPHAAREKYRNSGVCGGRRRTNYNQCTVTSVACRLSADRPPNLKKTPPEPQKQGGCNRSAQHSPA